MNCPKCGNKLRISKKDPNYGLCDTCRKKFRLTHTAPAADTAEDQEEEHHLRYANIPPKEEREKREKEMRKAYDELLAIGKEERGKKKRKRFPFFS